jgi:SAM-dependent methyltransferase
VVDLLDVQSSDTVLEVGLAPGCDHAASGQIGTPCRGCRFLSGNAPAGDEAQCRAVGNDRIELRQGFADRLPFAAESFEKAMAINSIQVWPDASAGLRELWRVLKPGGRLALAFTAQPGQ